MINFRKDTHELQTTNHISRCANAKVIENQGSRIEFLGAVNLLLNRLKKYKYWLICITIFFRDIGIEAIKRANFAKFVDVRLLEGYPVEGRFESKG